MMEVKKAITQPIFKLHSTYRLMEYDNYGIDDNYENYENGHNSANFH